MTELSKKTELQQSGITDVSSSCSKIPYTKNTSEARKFLEQNRYTPLSFFQGKEFISPIVSNYANKNAQWLVYDYTTFNKDEVNSKTYLQDKDCDFEKFKSEIVRLYPK
jgi:hypothetical protein